MQSWFSEYVSLLDEFSDTRDGEPKLSLATRAEKLEPGIVAAELEQLTDEYQITLPAQLKELFFDFQWLVVDGWDFKVQKLNIKQIDDPLLIEDDEPLKAMVVSQHPSGLELVVVLPENAAESETWFLLDPEGELTGFPFSNFAESFVGIALGLVSALQAPEKLMKQTDDGYNAMRTQWLEASRVNIRQMAVSPRLFDENPLGAEGEPTEDVSETLQLQTFEECLDDLVAVVGAARSN